MFIIFKTIYFIVGQKFSFHHLDVFLRRSRAVHIYYSKPDRQMRGNVRLLLEITNSDFFHIVKGLQTRRAHLLRLKEETLLIQ